VAFPRWLRPSQPGSGFLFGYVFGYAAWLVLIAAFALKDGTPPRLNLLGYGLLWALPWAVLWCVSGAIARGIPHYPAAVVTLLGITSGTVYSLATGSFGGWQAVSIPGCTIAHFAIWHAVAVPSWLLIRWLRGDTTAD
jgi:hypothetical protein